MLKLSYFLTGFLGGMLGMMPLVSQSCGTIEYLTAFAFAFGLSVLVRDYFRDIRLRIQQRREEKVAIQRM